VPAAVASGVPGRPAALPTPAPVAAANPPHGDRVPAGWSAPTGAPTPIAPAPPAAPGTGPAPAGPAGPEQNGSTADPQPPRASASAGLLESHAAPNRDLWTAPPAELAAEVAKVPRRRREDFLPEAERVDSRRAPHAELPPGWTDPITGLPLADAMRADIELRATDFRTFSVVVCHPMMAMTTPGGMVNASPNAAFGEEELRIFAGVLRDTLRQKDIVGRYDERLFLLFLPRCKVEEVRIVMDRIRANLLLAQVNQPQWVDITFGAAPGEIGESVDGPLKVAYADLLQRNAGPAWFL
jgi:GGDEF domain-containing protein